MSDKQYKQQFAEVIMARWGMGLLVFFFLLRGVDAEPASGLEGRVVGENGHALENATIAVVGTARGTLTDRKGYFRLALVAGVYTVQVSHLGYEVARDSVAVKAGQTAVLDFVLESAFYVLDEVLVVGQITSAQVKALNAQNAAPNIKHVASHELFSRFPDRNAGETLQRLPGITLDRDQGEGEFVQVRGLSAQFNSVTVNGQRIPSPSADIAEGRAVGLDLLQIDNIEYIEVTKAITPDMDADALGGSINMVLRRAPEEAEYRLKVATGRNDKAARFSEWGREIVEVSGTAGRRFYRDRLGLVLGGSLYRTHRGSLLQQVGYSATDAIDYNLWDNYDVRRRRLGLLGGVDYRFAEDHEIRLNYTYNIFHDDEIRRRREYKPLVQEEEMEVRNRREDQRYSMLELSGQRRFSLALIDYGLSLSQASEELPDRTYFLFERANSFVGAEGELLSADVLRDLDLETSFPALAPFELVRNRFDNKKFSERDLTAQLDAEFSIALGPRSGTAKTGFKIWRKNKKARERRWEYKPGDLAITTAENDYVFVGVKYDDDEATALFPLGRYQSIPQLLNYDAEETVYAAYAMSTLNWTSKFSSLAGVRGELTRHAYAHQANFEESDEGYYNILPSLHLTYRFSERSNLRLALTSGLARPEYTRLLPITTPPDDGIILQGNPDLVATKALGFDLMLEAFPGALGLLSAGLFVKRISDPVVVFSQSRGVFTLLQPINGEAGSVWGLEFALVHHLGTYAWPLLRHAGVYANYTYSAAEMDYGTARTDRGPLPGNARHSANLGLFYDAAVAGRALTLSFNYRSPMLKGVEAEKRNDIWYDDEVHMDLSARQRLSARLELYLKLNNLLDQDETEVLGDPYGAGVTRWREREQYGRSGLLGLSYSF